MATSNGCIGRQRLCALAIIPTILALAAAIAPAESRPPSTAPVTIPTRIIKTFDFNERPLGNYEPMPMHWRQILSPGFPRFLEASIDEKVGHAAPPSFHLPLRSGSLGASYLARDIPTNGDSAFRITAWIKPRRLVHGGAVVTACYLGQNLKMMPGSERRSEIIRGDGEDEPWRQVIVDLPGGVRHARWIALSCRVEQPDAGTSPDETESAIAYHDARGEAWFDDISIIRMPSVTLTLDQEDGIYDTADASPVITVGLIDADGANLSLNLELRDADGRRIEQRSLSTDSTLFAPACYTPRNLPPGQYTAVLTVTADGSELVRTSRSFVRFAGGGENPAPGIRSFGIVLDDIAINELGPARRYFEILRPGIVKIPVWRSGLSDADVMEGSQRIERQLKRLHDDGMVLVGTIESPPATLAEQYEPDQRGLFQILAGEPWQWKPYLALVMTRTSPWMDYWQIGAEQVNPLLDRTTLASAVEKTSREITPLIGPAKIVVSISPDRETSPADNPSEITSLAQPPGRSAAAFAQSLNSPEAPASKRKSWATLHSLPADQYDRTGRLGDFARGFLLARCHGIDTVFTDMPWEIRGTGDHRLIEPKEELIVLHTLAGATGDLKPAGRIAMGDDVEAWLFADAEERRGVVAVWANGESPRPSTLRFDFGSPTRVTDLWGNTRSLPRATFGHELGIGATPLFVGPIKPDDVRLASALSISDPLLTVTIEDHQREFSFRNPLTTQLRGDLTLSGPPGWRVVPNRFKVDLRPGETLRASVQIRLPSNQATGDFEWVARFRGRNDDVGEHTLRLPVKVATPGLEVDAAAYPENGKLTIIQRVTNRTGITLDLRASLVSAQSPRQLRSIAGLGAGETAIRRYQLTADQVKACDAVRLSVEQVGGPMRNNLLLNLK